MWQESVPMDSVPTHCVHDMRMTRSYPTPPKLSYRLPVYGFTPRTISVTPVSYSVKQDDLHIAVLCEGESRGLRYTVNSLKLNVCEGFIWRIMQQSLNHKNKYPQYNSCT